MLAQTTLKERGPLTTRVVSGPALARVDLPAGVLHAGRGCALQ